MRKLLTACLIAGATAVASRADIILDWDFAGTGATVSQVANTIGSNLDTGGSYNDLTRGSGATASSGTAVFRTLGFQNNGISVANTDYFQFILSAASGYTLSLSGIDGAFSGTASYSSAGGVNHQWAYSTDGSTFTLIGSAVNRVGNGSSSFDFSGVSALQNVSDSTDVTLRYYATGQTSTGGWGFSSAGMTVNGTLTVVPEPSVVGLLAIGGLAAARFARRRNA